MSWCKFDIDLSIPAAFIFWYTEVFDLSGNAFYMNKLEKEIGIVCTSYHETDIFICAPYSLIVQEYNEDAII